MKKLKVDPGDFLLFVTTVVWGVSFPLGKIVLAEMGPLGYSSSRFLIAGLLLALWSRLREGPIRLPRKDLLTTIGLGIMGYFFFTGIWAVGLTMTTSAKASILISTSPVFALLMSAIIGKSPKPLAWLGVGISFLGTYLLITGAAAAEGLSGGSLIGDLIFLVAALCWALYNMISVPLIARHGPLKPTAVAMIIGSTLLLIPGFGEIVAVPYADLDAEIYGAYFITAVIGGTFGFVWWLAGIGRLGVARAIPYMYLVPVFGVLGGIYLLDEHLTLVQLGGAAITLVGVALARRG
ncbi:DMT family transporter [Oceanibacterium hippocampi]|uniref:S-adenosylmethionine/S-adenosylhomocysteine transporter n=1 Tax=Oceanibacterium hippocampi TaxID=745714 RepID=A0A1Y5U0I6_9PROT|nr:DMT family transporter [Oceanibacterium hippocampi]SLN73597.1 S-adenosylmethionine/S-adenosylhomocysteine transporter [Oceanibacterium hippocampi]